MADASFEFQGGGPDALAAKLEGFESALADELESAAEEIGLRILAEAKKRVNVDTGRLRASLASDVEDVGAYAVSVVVGSNVSYAPHHEYDYPFLRPSVESQREFIRQRVAEAIENAADRVS